MNASESREHDVVLLFRVSGWIHAPVDASCLIRLQGSIFKVCSKPFLCATWFSARQAEEQRGCSRYFFYFLHDYIFFEILFHSWCSPVRFLFQSKCFTLWKKRSLWVALTFREKKNMYVIGAWGMRESHSWLWS